MLLFCFGNGKILKIHISIHFQSSIFNKNNFLNNHLFMKLFNCLPFLLSFNSPKKTTKRKKPSSSNDSECIISFLLSLLYKYFKYLLILNERRNILQQIYCFNIIFVVFCLVCLHSILCVLLIFLFFFFWIYRLTVVVLVNAFHRSKRSYLLLPMSVHIYIVDDSQHIFFVKFCFCIRLCIFDSL